MKKIKIKLIERSDKQIAQEVRVHYKWANDSHDRLIKKLAAITSGKKTFEGFPIFPWEAQPRHLKNIIDMIVTYESEMGLTHRMLYKKEYRS